ARAAADRAEPAGRGRAQLGRGLRDAGDLGGEPAGAAAPGTCRGPGPAGGLLRRPAGDNRGSGSMTCAVVVELVTAFLEGTLDPETEERFIEHLALCPGCELYLDQFRQTMSALGELPQESL